MDPPLDPPPAATQPPSAVPAVVAAANPTHTQAPAHNHPPYAEMITAAISALNERNGSSKKAIVKYIEAHYSSLPSTHSALLTHHLKRLKTNGQVVMVKHSYKLPRSTAPPVNGTVNAPPTDPVSDGPKKRPGRPPKTKPQPLQSAVPVFVLPMNVNAVPAVAPGTQPPQNAAVQPGTVYVATGPVNGPARGRGRPPKQGAVKQRPGRPRKNYGTQAAVAVGRSRGRAKKTATPAAIVRKLGRQRGRPPKPINVVEGVAPAVDGGLAVAPIRVVLTAGDGLPVAGGFAAPVAGKRRGRHPRAAGEAKKPRTQSTGPQPKPRKLSGKPLGRPKKNASGTVSQSPDTQLLVAYLDVKGKLENLQSRIKQAAGVIKPCLNNEGAVTAMYELELLASVNIAPLNVHLQQPLPQQAQQPPMQPPPPEPTQLLLPQPQT